MNRNNYIMIARVVSISLLFITGINAIVAGLLFIIDPTGVKMRMSTSYLARSPFDNFLIPGVVLFLVNGLMNIIVAYLVLKNYKHFPLFVILQGFLLSSWIIIQVLMVRDFNGLHFSMLIIGFIFLILGLFCKKNLTDLVE